MEAIDDKMNFTDLNGLDTQQSRLSVLQEQAEPIASNRKLQTQKKYRLRVNWLILLLFFIVVVEAALFFNMMQRQATSEGKRQGLAAELAQLKQENGRLKIDLIETKAEREKLQEMARSGNRPYLNAALRQISASRRQASGMMSTPKGTVCQLKQLTKNAEGKSIEDVLYKTDQIRKERVKFNQERIKLMQRNAKLKSLGLSRFTLKIDRKLDAVQQQEQSREYVRIDEIHNLSVFSSQLPMCIIVPSYNNNAKFRLQYNLNSIFSQNYTNYFAVIINDASDDGSDEIIRKYFLFHNISTSRYVYIDNGQRRTALQNIYLAVWNHCSEDSIVVNLDGDDEFIGKNVLKVFNANYQKHRMGVVYSNYHRVYSDGRIEKGLTGQYSDQVKNQVSFRTSVQLFSHLKTHRAELFRRIPLKQLQDSTGHFFKITSDMAIYYPLMEISCGRVLKINGFHYLYNFNTGLNDFALNHKDQLAVQSIVRNGKKLQCATDLLLQWDK